ALADDRRQFLRGVRRSPNEVERHVPRRAFVVQLFLHMNKRCADDVVMVNVRTNGSHDVEPEGVDQLQIVAVERWRVSAKMVNGRAAAAVMDDEPDVE